MADSGTLRKQRNRRAGLPSDVAQDVRRSDRERPSQRDGSEKPERSGRGEERERDRERDRDRSRRDGEGRSRARPPKAQDTTANLVKKRYSIRYNQTPDDMNDAPPIPGMPKIPTKYTRESTREEARPGLRGEPDAKALYDPNLNTEKYMSNFFSSSSEQDISDFQRKLKKMTSRAQTDLQQNVYHNRTTFISISKEADKLKAEMQTLRGLMSDLTSTLGQGSSMANGNDTSADDTSRKRANRSSLANLEAMYNTQLQALWKNVEGSQKFLAAMPGRHIVMESGHWAELDGATLKPRRTVHIVLLNDHLLIAARKPKRMDTNDPKSRRPHTKLVAVRCWPMNEIDMVEVRAPSRDAEDALAIRHGQESYTFAGDRGDPKDQIELLQAFRRTKDELRRTERAANGTLDVKSKETNDYLAARDPAVSKNPTLLGTLSRAKNQPEVLIDVDGKQRNLRWVEGQIDELDIEVALQRFEEAVAHVEQLRKLAKGLKGNAVAQEVITVKVDERATKLADILTQRLIATPAWLSNTQTTVGHLTRLNCAAQARRAYLSARSAVIAQRARACVFAGDIMAHVTDLSYVYFTLIKNTVSIYSKCFPREMNGAVVVWAKMELDRFNEALGRALGGFNRGSDAWKGALNRAKELAAELGEVGIDFEGMVGEGLDVDDESNGGERKKERERDK